jgi:subtilisin family serine protease
MTEKKYIVTLNKGVDVEEFCHHMENDTTGVDCGCIPDRTVDVSNRRPLSIRSTEYVLSDEEAQHLRSDPRVMGVDVDAPPEAKALFATQESDFNRNSTANSNYVNWGLRRCILESIEPTVGNTYNYNLDGTGVDIVIQDNGVMSGHPEWEDENGVSRYQDGFDWYAEANYLSSMPAGHYGDVGNHGTHVAGIAAGKTYGWAKGARIYSIRFDLLPAGDEMDLIRIWHQNKPVDPVTGVKRPTIVNASWGYRWFNPTVGFGYFYQGGAMTEINYRGNLLPTNTNKESIGMVNSAHNIAGYTFVDAATEDMTDAGVILVKAAGNYFHKQDVPGGADYDNYYKLTQSWGVGIIPAGQPIYYHRPGSPHSSDTIVVANVDNTARSATLEELRSSTEKGPRIDVCAPGSEISSATNSQGFGSAVDSVYPFDSNYKISRIGGTSMASPQVAGMLALFLQVNPTATAQQCKNWLYANSKAVMYEGSGTGDDYSDDNSLQGGSNRFLYNPFNSPYRLRIS